MPHCASRFRKATHKRCKPLLGCYVYRTRRQAALSVKHRPQSQISLASQARVSLAVLQPSKRHVNGSAFRRTRIRKYFRTDVTQRHVRAKRGRRDNFMRLLYPTPGVRLIVQKACYWCCCCGARVLGALLKLGCISHRTRDVKTYSWFRSPRARYQCDLLIGQRHETTYPHWFH